MSKKINLDNLTIGQIKEINSLLNSNVSTGVKGVENNNGLNSMIGKYCIIRTYSAGVFAGIVKEKSQNEIILKDARRLYYWKAENNSATLSGVAIYGLTNDSKVMEEVNSIWLQPIEIILCSEVSEKSIKEKVNYVTR